LGEWGLITIIGTYRADGITSSASFSDGVINITGFKPSGIEGGNAIATCLYVWSGTTSSGHWVPLRREWL